MSAPRLTPRQRDVVRLLADGLSYKCIGHRLGLTPRTVEFYVRRIADALPDDWRTSLPARQRVQTWAAEHGEHYRTLPV